MMKIQRILDRLWSSTCSRRNKGFGPFPDDILIDILSWLPAKDVLRCRIVCTRWRTLTTSTYFILMQRQRAFSTNLVQGDPLCIYDHLPIALNKVEKEVLDFLVSRRSAIKERQQNLEEEGQQVVSDSAALMRFITIPCIIMGTNALSECQSVTCNKCYISFFICFAFVVMAVTMSWFSTELRCKSIAYSLAKMSIEFEALVPVVGSFRLHVISALEVTPTRKALFEEASSPYLFFWDQLRSLEAPMEFKEKEVFFMRGLKQRFAMFIVAFGVILCTAFFLCKKRAITDDMVQAFGYLNMLLSFGLTIYSMIPLVRSNRFSILWEPYADLGGITELLKRLFLRGSQPRDVGYASQIASS